MISKYNIILINLDQFWDWVAGVAVVFRQPFIKQSLIFSASTTCWAFVNLSFSFEGIFLTLLTKILTTGRLYYVSIGAIWMNEYLLYHYVLIYRYSLKHNNFTKSKYYYYNDNYNQLISKLGSVNNVNDGKAQFYN